MPFQKHVDKTRPGLYARTPLAGAVIPKVLQGRRSQPAPQAFPASRRQLLTLLSVIDYLSHLWPPLDRTKLVLVLGRGMDGMR